MLVYDEICIKAKVRECNGVIKTNFLGGEVSKEGVDWACIVYVTIDSVMKMGKKNELSASFFIKVQKQNKEDKDA